MAERPPAETDAPVVASIAALRARLLCLAVKLVWNRSDAEEIVQEALTLAVQKRQPLFEAGGQAWAYRTVCNLCLNQRRKRRVEPLEPWLALDESVGPASRMERAEELDRLRLLVEQLPAQQRLALTLRDMEQMDYARVAAIMDLTESAVRTHVRLARQRLAETMRRN